MPEVAGDCPKISLGEFFLDASVPNGPNYNTPELIGDLKKLTGPNAIGHTYRYISPFFVTASARMTRVTCT